MKQFIYIIFLIPIMVLGQDQNYVRSTTYKVATTNSISNSQPNQASVTTSYIDGLGRPIQQVAHKQASNGNDIVTHFEYDAFGRQVKEYLPYVSTSSSLNYFETAKSDTESYYNTAYYESTLNPYSEKQFEASPLNRILKQSAPGNVWAMGSGKEIKFEYQANGDNEVKLYKAAATWNATVALYDIELTNGEGTTFYSANQLYKTITKDENWVSGKNNTTEEFKDKEGKIILKRTYDNAIAHDTYYVYDQYGNLTYVIPPLADGVITSNVLNGLCYQYKYDYRNRLVEKKLPGKQWEFIVYDKLDRVVMTGPVKTPFTHLSNDGWMFTKYDAFNRVVMSGWMTATSINSAQRKSRQDERNNAVIFNESRLPSGNTTSAGTGNSSNPAHSYSNICLPTTGYYILSINYYDDYNYVDSPTVPTALEDGQLVYYNNTVKPKGLQTGKWVKVLTNTLSSPPTRKEVSYTLYDYKARPIRTYTVNHESSSPGRTQIDTKYDFEGKMESSVTKHKRTNAGEDITIKDFYTYTDQGKLLTHTHQVNNRPIELLSKNDYDALGQLLIKQVGGTDTNTYLGLQEVDYRYNIRGWLKSINNVTNLGSDLFAFKLNYNEVEDETTQTENQYVGKALYNGNISETYWITDNDNIKRKYGYFYDALNRLKQAVYQRPGADKPVRNSYNENITYDKNGNISMLTRTGEYDDAIYDFVIDDLAYTYDVNNPNRLLKVDDSSNNPNGFKDVSNSTDYEYDDYGNMTVDRNKEIVNIRYNHLNLPVIITFANENKIEYVYNGEGKKLEKLVKQVASETTTKYIEGFQYVDNILTFFPHEEGYMSKNGSNFNYVYHYKDHLGNIRLSYSKDLATGLPVIMEENNYYPFGLKHRNYNMTQLEYTEVGGAATLESCTDCNYKYKYNGKELQDELGLNMYDYGWRNYMPDVGRWTQIDPLFNDLKFAHDNEDVDPDDHEEVYMAIINDLEIGGGIYNTDNLNPYGYGYNNPVSFDDPDGRCPACWGALIGAGVDIALQMTSNAVQGKDLTDINWKQVGVSAVAGAISGGISSISKIKNASALVKVGVEVATDTGVSVGSQVVNDGKVTLKKTIIDVTAGQVVGRGVGKVAEKRALNSAKGKQLQASVNKQKNIARGKSNITPKSKADVKGAEKKFDRYVNTRATASSATASGAASTTAENASKKKKETNQN